MSPTDAIRTCFRKYATFSGRASRPEYWWFFLFLFLCSALADTIDAALFGSAAPAIGPGGVEIERNEPIGSLFALLTTLPLLAVAWRRMHDSGRSGLHVLYPLIVMIGIVTFTAATAGFAALLRGDLGAMLAGATGIIVLLSMAVLVISPLLVLWWLTRPSDPGPNKYGPLPHNPNRNEVPQ